MILSSIVTTDQSNYIHSISKISKSNFLPLFSDINSDEKTVVNKQRINSQKTCIREQSLTSRNAAVFADSVFPLLRSSNWVFPWLPGRLRRRCAFTFGLTRFCFPKFHCVGNNRTGVSR